MPALPSVNAIKLNVAWQVDADTLAQTIHYWTFSGGAASADLASFAAAAVSQGASHFGSLVGNAVGMLSATARDLSSAMGQEGTGGSPWVGTRGTARLAPATAAVVSHFIGRHYRGGKPRTYLPAGVSADVVAAGTWDPAFVTAVESGWGAWVAALNGSTYGALNITALSNVSYFGPPNRIITGSTGRVRTVSTVRSTPIVDRITGHTVRSIIGSQRRRNRDA
jgi:hypothetical protein